MSKIFAALKKAKKEQAETLFQPSTEKESEASALKPFNTPPPVENSSTASVTNVEKVEPTSIASVPAPSTPRIRAKTSNHLQVTLLPERGNLVVLGQSSPARDQFAGLCAKLSVLRHEQGMQTVCVTSSVMQEGKTFVATNLALALAAESESGAILVDCDLRNPSVHRAFGIRDTTGLADFLRSDRTNIDAIIIDTDRRLACIPVGHIPDNPLSLLDSEKMKWLIAQLRERYSFVILDVPPTAPLADADILASLSDGVLFVVRAGLTPLTLVKRSLKMLGKRALLGTVLNGVKELPNYSYGYGQTSKQVS
ncbi:MAG: CpsD/CapB family tyrosine-protein kinase [Acidobacteriota bacterium]